MMKEPEEHEIEPLVGSSKGVLRRKEDTSSNPHHQVSQVMHTCVHRFPYQSVIDIRVKLTFSVRKVW